MFDIDWFSSPNSKSRLLCIHWKPTSNSNNIFKIILAWWTVYSQENTSQHKPQACCYRSRPYNMRKISTQMKSTTYNSCKLFLPLPPRELVRRLDSFPVVSCETLARRGGWWEGAKKRQRWLVDRVSKRANQSNSSPILLSIHIWLQVNSLGWGFIIHFVSWNRHKKLIRDLLVWYMVLCEV